MTFDGEKERTVGRKTRKAWEHCCRWRQKPTARVHDCTSRRKRDAPPHAAPVRVLPPSSSHLVLCNFRSWTTCPIPSNRRYETSAVVDWPLAVVSSSLAESYEAMAMAMAMSTCLSDCHTERSAMEARVTPTEYIITAVIIEFRAVVLHWSRHQPSEVITNQHPPNPFRAVRNYSTVVARQVGEASFDRKDTLLPPAAPGCN